MDGKEPPAVRLRKERKENALNSKSLEGGKALYPSAMGGEIASLRRRRLFSLGEKMWIQIANWNTEQSGRRINPCSVLFFFFLNTIMMVTFV